MMPEIFACDHQYAPKHKKVHDAILHDNTSVAAWSKYQTKQSLILESSSSCAVQPPTV